jgi:hypothetical protein
MRQQRPGTSVQVVASERAEDILLWDVKPIAIQALGELSVSTTGEGTGSIAPEVGDDDPLCARLSHPGDLQRPEPHGVSGARVIFAVRQKHDEARQLIGRGRTISGKAANLEGHLLQQSLQGEYQERMQGLSERIIVGSEYPCTSGKGALLALGTDKTASITCGLLRLVQREAAHPEASHLELLLGFPGDGGPQNPDATQPIQGLLLAPGHELLLVIEALLEPIPALDDWLDFFEEGFLGTE